MPCAPFDVVAKELRDLLTARLVAYVGGVRETRAVHQWANGTREVTSGDVEDRLRFALQVALLLLDDDAPRVVHAWFQGLAYQVLQASTQRFTTFVECLAYFRPDIEILAERPASLATTEMGPEPAPAGCCSTGVAR